MKKRRVQIVALLLAVIATGCSLTHQSESVEDKKFSDFENRFLDAYWRQHPAASINAGYGKYYDLLEIPDSSAVAGNIDFSRSWIDSLNAIQTERLNVNNKISLKIIRNQLESDIWYLSVFKQQEWDASVYNLAGGCDYIINQPYAPLDERLKTLSKHLQHADLYYAAAIRMLQQPTKEHIAMAIKQNEGGLSLFGQALSDSISASKLTDAEKNELQQNIAKTVKAINNYLGQLKAIIADPNYKFRSFRIGKKLFAEKFSYDLVTDFTPEEAYQKALSDKKIYTGKMYHISDSIWGKYYGNEPKPADSLQLIRRVLAKIDLQHVQPKEYFSYLTQQVELLKKFIVEKDLFDFDTTSTPVKVRMMPAYARGFSLANAEFTPPYQKQGTTYFNIDDLTLYDPQKAESALREYNNYSSQILAIHEAVPGHCLQGIYNNKKSPDVVRSVFQNGAMIEGWAVYTQEMMVDNGWGDHAPEMELILYKWKLRELANVLIDYDIQCLGKSKEEIVHLLTNDCFQTEAQAAEKYNRATVSQVQLCSYFTGTIAIKSLRDEYRKKMGDKYRLKDFHEKFLGYGCSPVKYIRECMLN